MEEDEANRRARKKSGGNSGKRHTEGWIEFEDKKIARGWWLSLPSKVLHDRELRERFAPCLFGAAVAVFRTVNLYPMGLLCSIYCYYYL